MRPYRCFTRAQSKGAVLLGSAATAETHAKRAKLALGTDCNISATGFALDDTTRDVHV
jgi:hypothetical protein